MAKKKISPALDKWRNHLAEFRKANPKLSMKECMEKAAKSYKKS